MPRKRADTKKQSDGFNKAFPTVLRILMEDRNITQKMLADYLGKKNRQTVSYYCDGTSSPDWETLVSIADYFDISVDYLLGRTNDPSRHPCATDELGLSPRAIHWLEEIGPKSPLEHFKGRISILNALVDGDDSAISMLYDAICEYYYAINVEKSCNALYDLMFSEGNDKETGFDYDKSHALFSEMIEKLMKIEAIPEPAKKYIAAMNYDSSAERTPFMQAAFTLSSVYWISEIRAAALSRSCAMLIEDIKEDAERHGFPGILGEDAEILLRKFYGEC